MRHWTLTLSLFLNYFVFAILLNSVGTVILQVQNSFGVSASQASILEACKDLSIAITSFAVAAFLMRFGYRRAMLLALVAVGIACLVMPSIPEFWMTKLLFVTVGIGFALVKVSVFACIGLLTEDQKAHASMMNFIESFFMVGILSGYFIFSAFVDDNNISSTDWLNVYYMLGALCAVAASLLIFFPVDDAPSKNPEDNTVDHSSQATEFISMIKMCLRPLVYLFVISAFLYVLIEQSIMTWLPTFNSEVLKLSPSLSIQMASILAGATALGRFFAGMVLRKVDWFWVLLACLLAASALVILALPMASIGAPDAKISSWSQAPLVAFVFPLLGLCLAPIYPALNSVILSALPRDQHAPMAGLIVVFSALGGTSGSMITGHLFEMFGGLTAFYFSLAPIAIIICVLVLFRREIKRQARIQEQQTTHA